MIFLSLMMQIYIDSFYSTPVIPCGNINFVILGYDNDPSPIQYQAIIW